MVDHGLTVDPKGQQEAVAEPGLEGTDRTAIPVVDVGQRDRDRPVP
jgi:hypothetical protein